jgi:hypothetical protein
LEEGDSAFGQAALEFGSDLPGTGGEHGFMRPDSDGKLADPNVDVGAPPLTEVNFQIEGRDCADLESRERRTFQERASEIDAREHRRWSDRSDSRLTLERLPPCRT